MGDTRNCAICETPLTGDRRAEFRYRLINKRSIILDIGADYCPDCFPPLDAIALAVRGSVARQNALENGLRVLSPSFISEKSGIGGGESAGDS